MKKEKNSSWFYFCYQQCARNHLSEDDIYLEVWRFDGFSRIGWRLLSIVCWPGYPRLSQSHNSLDPRNPEMPPCMNIDADYRSWDEGKFDLCLCCDLIYVAKHIWKIHMWQSCHLGKGVCHVMQFFPIFNLKKTWIWACLWFTLCLTFCTFHLYVTKR